MYYLLLSTSQTYGRKSLPTYSIVSNCCLNTIGNIRIVTPGSWSSPLNPAVYLRNRIEQKRLKNFMVRGSIQGNLNVISGLRLFKLYLRYVDDTKQHRYQIIKGGVSSPLPYNACCLNTSETKAPQN